MALKSKDDEIKRDFGRWWLSSAPDKHVLGTLERLPDGRQTLRLSGQLAGDSDGGEFRICGYVGIGTAVSLSGCHVSYTDIIASSPREDWHVHESVRGAELPEGDDWKFESATFSMPGVSKWAEWQQFTAKFEGGADDGFATLSYSATKRSVPLWEIDGMRTTLGNAVGVVDQDESSIHFQSRYDVIVASDLARSSHDLYRAGVFPLQVIIALATGVYTASQSGQVMCRDADSGRTDYCERRWHPHSLEVDPARILSFGFTLSHLRDAELDLGLWVQRLKTIESVGDLYLAFLSNTVRFTEVRFQLIVQALETYHRETIGGSILQEEEWTCLLRELRNVVDQQTLSTSKRRQLRGKLGGGNSLLLSVRLQQLFESLGTVGEQIAAMKVGQFSNLIATTRNRVTHLSEQATAVIPAGEQMMHATERLVALLEILLLKDMGLPLEGPAVGEVLRRRVKWLPNVSATAEGPTR